MTIRPAVRVVSSAPADVTADVLIVPVFENEGPDGLAPFSDLSGGDLSGALASRAFRAKPYELWWAAPKGWRSARVLFVGAGARADWTGERQRRLAIAAAVGARQRGAGRLAFVTRLPLDAEAVQAAVEGMVLASLDVDTYKTSTRESVPLTDLAVIVSDAAPSFEQAAERGRVLAEAANHTRALANEPSNVLTPIVFAERAATLLDGGHVTVDILDERRITDLGMGLLLGVARGSAEPPRVMALTYTPEGGTKGPVLGLVGKGITFDTGGISIKPADGMDRMKDDMAGGAAVIGAMRAIGRLKPDIKVVGVVAATENMPGGRAFKPGDVLTSASGKTVEINNTDAEGRLVLGDALWYAQQLGATHLVDVATLTGAVAVALGRYTSGLFGTPEWWVDLVRETATRAGDRLWPLPIYEEALEQMRSEIADLINSGWSLRWREYGRRLPAGVHGRPAVGASRHRRHGVDRRGQAVAAEGAECGRHPHTRGAAVHGIALEAER